MADERATPRLNFTISQNQQLVELSYRVQNSSPQSIYLFNRLYKTNDAEGRLQIDPNLCSIEVKDNTIHIAKKIYPVPEHMGVERLNLPCVSELVAGKELTEKVALQVPLRQWNPYISDQSNTQRRRLLPVVFELGYFFAVRGTKELAAVVPTTAGECLRFDPFPITSQLIVSAGPSAERVEILA